MPESLRILRAEHEAILDLLSAIERLCARLAAGQSASPEVFQAITEALGTYVHCIHREKEEDLLFPTLRRKGLHEGAGCVGVLMAEHDEGRVAFASMSAAAESNSAATWAQSARQYCEALRNHIRREEQVAFSIAASSLTDAEDSELLAAFQKVDEKARRAGMLARIHQAQEAAQSAAA